MTEEETPREPGDHTGPEGDAGDDPDDASDRADDDPADEVESVTDADPDADAVPDADAASDDEGTDLTHVDESGDVQMVDVGAKPDSARRAVARGVIHLTASTVEAVRNDEVEKGDVLATARVGAVQAVKHTWETIPMCHQIPVTNVETAFDVRDDRVVLTVAVETTGKTGCEMEALEGVTTGLNVVWDMVKAAEKDADGQYPETRIADVHVVEKTKREA